jgi:hypothetical protein
LLGAQQTFVITAIVTLCGAFSSPSWTPGYRRSRLVCPLKSGPS